MKIKKLQMGGEMLPPTEEAAMAEQNMDGATAEQAPVGDPMEELVGMLVELGAMAEQALQTQDPAMMAEVCNTIATIAAEVGGAGAQEEVPMFKKGTGKMIKKKKCAKGGTMKKCAKGGEMKKC